MESSTKSSYYHILLKLYISYIKTEKKTLILTFVAVVVIAITTAVNAWIMQPILDDIFVQKNIKMLYVLPVAVLLNGCVRGCAEFYQNYAMKSFGQKIVGTIQMELYSHLIYSDLKLFHKLASGKLLSSFTNEINTIKRAIIDLSTGLVRDMTVLILLVCLMIYQSIEMSGIFLIIMPLIAVPLIRLGKRMNNSANTTQDSLSSFAVHLDETFKNIAVIKSYGREQHEINHAKNLMAEISQTYKHTSKLDSIVAPLMEAIGGLAIGAALLYGGISVLDGTLTPGAFFSFIGALMMAYRPLKTISQLNSILHEGMAAASRIFKILDTMPSVVEKPGATRINFANNYGVKFNNVSFAYGEKKILKNINFKIECGKTAAFVGVSGGGKSTILHLLQRFHDVDSGSILIGQHNIKDMQISQLRETIALVSQDIALFDTTIFENIRYGNLEATMDEVVAAARMAGADEFIRMLENGYNTPIGQAGVRLSGGQKQRIAIARAMLKNAPILLLDEATSALDTLSEKAVQRALNTLKSGKTTLVIAHRLSTIVDADVIFVVDNGMIVDSGTHHELLEKSVQYSHLYRQYQ